MTILRAAGRSLLTPCRHDIGVTKQLTLLRQSALLRRHFSKENENNEQFLQEICMPSDLGKGTVVKWYKNVGDVIEYDDVYVDIQTEDFTFGMSHDEEEQVTLQEIVVPVDDEVNDGDVLCTFVRDEAPGAEEDSDDQKN